MNPTVSVILTTFNQGRWLKEAIESVLAQSFADWELLILDNGSSDDSQAIISPFLADERIANVRYRENSPHTVINNAAVRRARGQYISLLCGDDYYLPHKLERQVAAFDGLTAQHGAVYCAGYRLMPDGRLLEAACASCAGDILESLLTAAPRQLFPPIAPLMRRECLLRYPFNEAVFIEGEAVYAKIALHYHFAPVLEPLVVMRDHDTNLGKEISSNFERNVIMLNELFDHPDFPDRLQHFRGRLMARTFRLAGWQAIRRERNYAVARDRLRTAMAHDSSMRSDLRVRAGLILARMPRWMADVCQRAIDSWVAVPPALKPGTRRASASSAHQ